jgi:hypothetical protein
MGIVSDVILRLAQVILESSQEGLSFALGSYNALALIDSASKVSLTDPFFYVIGLQKTDCCCTRRIIFLAR